MHSHSRVFTFSLGAALLAVFMVQSYVDSSISNVRDGYGEEVPVVVASRDIKDLDVLDDVNLIEAKVPKKFVQPGATSRIEDFRGALAMGTIFRGEQITRSKVTLPGPRTGLSRQIAAGKRAVTVQVNDTTSVGKMIKPGDHVDVAATIDPTGAGNRLFFETRVILQNRLVLATGKNVIDSVPGIMEVDPDKPKLKTKVPLAEYTSYSTVTLEVDPHQVTSLIFAAKNLDIYLILRNNDEQIGEVEVPKAMMQDLLGRPIVVPARK